LYKKVEVDLYTAVLGGEITVPTMDGKVKLKVSPGTQNDTKVRLKGKGFPVYRQEGKFGDLYITYQVEIPKSLSEKEKELFTQLSNIRNHGRD
jgi:curved DNA-binding protein